jgi:CBS-domain-containing membrane protein
MSYLEKMRGAGQSPPRVSRLEVLWSWLGAALSMAALALIQAACVGRSGAPLIFGPLGASAVLVFGAPKSPLAQPRNLVGGHLVSALVGVACYKLLGPVPWLAEAAAVATAIALMHATRTLHPPGGATALIAVIGSEEIHRLGWLYVLVPATLGPLILLAVALVVNNLPTTRRYPEVWL